MRPPGTCDCPGSDGQFTACHLGSNQVVAANLTTNVSILLGRCRIAKDVSDLRRLGND